MKRRVIQYLHINAIHLLLAFYAVAGIVTMYLFDGTGDSGDSIMHYLFARYAPAHPELYFDHWAKPVFVLISSPFAQFGFIGMKVFNLSTSILAFQLTYLTAKSLNISNPLLSVVFLMFMPLYYILTFSGLTEPLFSLFLIGGVFLAVHRKYIAASVIVSLMPFVRSEGLIIMIVFGIWLLVRKQWKYLPWLLTGHLIYAVAGNFLYHDLLWVFTKIPYSNLDSKYGSGPLLHFVYQINYVIGIPLYFLTVIGIISYGWHWSKKNVVIPVQETILVFLGFTLFFIAHSLFWYFGIFNSMGLKRVLLGVAPLISLIALRGFNFITLEAFHGYKIIGRITGIMLVAVVVLFPFSGNPAAINWKKEMKLTSEQSMARAVAGFIRENPVQPNNKLLYSHPYLSVALNLDHFDASRRQDLNLQNLEFLQPGDKVVWDSWFSIIENGVPLDNLLGRDGLVREIDFSSKVEGQEIRFVVFRRK